MRFATQAINGVTFGFLFTNATRENGLIIPVGTDTDMPEFATTLKSAMEASEWFCNICQITELIQMNASLKHYGEDELLVLRHMINGALCQTWWNVGDFEVDARLKFEAFAEMVGTAIAPKQHKHISQSGRAGYVYLLRSDTGYYKIGRTKNPEDRRRTFEVKLPFAIEFDVVIQTDDMFNLESELHTMFANKRVNGEWFDLSLDDVAYIKSLAVRS